jgi:hypothetical protein
MIFRGERLFGSIVCLAAVLALGAPRATAADPSRAAVDLQARYSSSLEQLAKWCEENGLADEARKTRRVISPADPDKLYVPVLPDAVGPPKLPADAPPKLVEWDARLWRLRRDQATTLYAMARQAVRNGRAGLAFEMALAAIQANPDYEPARRLFGYQKFHDQWRTLYEVKKLRAGCLWSDQFGWLPKATLRRYEQGERLCDGRWISAAEDAKRHAEIDSGWIIDTEHYTIRTDHSIEAAVALGVKLERLYRLWSQLFVRYYASQADVVAMFDGRAKPSAAQRRHDVVYFRDRDEYVRSLEAEMPNIAITVGVYRDQPRRAYFFPGKHGDDRTLYHEATHQLFHESRPVAPSVAQQANFWIVEGIAMFMESLRQENGYYVLGGFGDLRLNAAQYRLLHDHFYVPLDVFTGYGMEQFQNDPRIATLYSQAAGLTHFLIFFDGGRFRDALVSYLTAIYAGRADRGTLSTLTGAAYGDLDKQYRKFLTDGAAEGAGS